MSISTKKSIFGVLATGLAAVSFAIAPAIAHADAPDSPKVPLASVKQDPNGPGCTSEQKDAKTSIFTCTISKDHKKDGAIVMQLPGEGQQIDVESPADSTNVLRAHQFNGVYNPHVAGEFGRYVEAGEKETFITNGKVVPNVRWHDEKTKAWGVVVYPKNANVDTTVKFTATVN